MNIPYRTRRALRRLGIAALIVLLLAVVIWLCWVVWLERYVIYTDEGAKLDLSLSADALKGQPAVAPEPGETVSIYINEGSNTVASTELTQLNGYYIDTDALSQGLDTVREQLAVLPPETPVMVDVKGIRGTFFYSTQLGPMSTAVDTAGLDALIAELSQSKHYLIARVPALRDREYGLNHVDDGLFLPSGIGLWMDDEGCYWLNPTAAGPMNYLRQIVNELRSLGFDEVVLSDFRFPDGNYTFDGDRSASLTAAAEALTRDCTTTTFALSFVSDTDFALPEGRTRLYLEGIEASDVAEVVRELTLQNKEIRTVILAESNDTRYDALGVLRPLETAH